MQLLLPPLPFRKNNYFQFLKKTWDKTSKAPQYNTECDDPTEVTFGYVSLKTFNRKLTELI